MRLLFAADLHGDEAHYAALLDLAGRARPDALLLGGDLFAHARSAPVQIAFARGPLRAFLGRAGLPVYGIAGNTDWPAAMREVEGWLTLLTLAPVRGVAGHPFVPPTPFRRKDYERRDMAGDPAVLPEGAYVSDAEGGTRAAPADHLDRLPSIEEDLAALSAEVAVWVMHGPPHGALDTAAGGVHAGSRALRAAIERLQPAAVLCGHIHEAPDLEGRRSVRIGRTLCVNPGRGGRLRAAVVEVGPGGEAQLA